MNRWLAGRGNRYDGVRVRTLERRGLDFNFGSVRGLRFEQAGGEHAEHGPAQVRHVRNPALINGNQRANLVEELRQQPQSNQNECRNVTDVYEPSEEEHGLNPISRPRG